MFNFKHLLTTNLVQKMAIIVDSVNNMVAQGKIAWKTIGQKQTAFQAWSSANSIPYSQWKCGQTVTLAPTCAPNGLAESNKPESDFLALAPNPANHKLLVSWKGQLNEKTILEMYDPLGRLVYHEKMQRSVIEMNVGNFKPGIYTVIIQNDAGQAKPAKLLITH